MAAHAAGLQRDDVLVQLDGQSITAWPSLSPVLAAHRPGDRVAAVFYRGPEQRRVTVELSPRPPIAPPEWLPPWLRRRAPSTPRSTLKWMRCSPECRKPKPTTARSPTPGMPSKSWPNLIAVERDTHTWITKMIEGGDLSDQFHVND